MVSIIFHITKWRNYATLQVVKTEKLWSIQYFNTHPWRPNLSYRLGEASWFPIRNLRWILQEFCDHLLLSTEKFILVSRQDVIRCPMQRNSNRKCSRLWQLFKKYIVLLRFWYLWRPSLSISRLLVGFSDYPAFFATGREWIF